MTTTTLCVCGQPATIFLSDFAGAVCTDCFASVTICPCCGQANDSSLVHDTTHLDCCGHSLSDHTVAGCIAIDPTTPDKFCACQEKGTEA